MLLLLIYVFVNFCPVQHAITKLGPHDLFWSSVRNIIIHLCYRKVFSVQYVIRYQIFIVSCIVDVHLFSILATQDVFV